MTRFLVIIRGGSMPEDPEEGARVMQAWNDWFAELGGAVVDPGSPLSRVRIISADGSVGSGDNHSATGYMVIQAGDLEAAVVLAKGCPLGDDMSVEVAETTAI